MQTAAGFNDAEQKAAGGGAPRGLPCQMLERAFCQLMALERRAGEGGSWLGVEPPRGP